MALMPATVYRQYKYYRPISGRPFLAEDCILPGFDEGPLTRKLPLKLEASAAISDPERTLTKLVL